MNTSPYLAEAIRIADDLISKAEHSENGIYWKTMSMDSYKENASIWNVTDGLYNGVGGITLFFIELYKHVPDKKYLEIIIKSSSWLIEYANDHPTKFYNFFSGRLGTAYCLAKVYLLTNEEKYKSNAIAIALESVRFLKLNELKYDLLLGPPGALLGLIHIYEMLKEEKILQVAHLFLENILDQLCACENGIYWNRNRNQIKALCGFSHGASGMAFIFLELGKYFNNKNFYWLAEQLFNYENSHFDNEYSNWPDFRKSLTKEKDYEEFLKKYEDNNLAFFTSSADMNAWCHGAAGIGLARIKAHEVLRNIAYINDLKKSVEKTIQTTIRQSAPKRQSFILCHGACGNAEVFLEATKVWPEDEWLMQYARQIADAAIQEFKQFGGFVSGYSLIKEQNDTSLFMGNAGIGYFMLRCYDSVKTDSILAPQLNATFQGAISYFTSFSLSLRELKNKILRKYFSRSFRLLERHFPHELDSFFANITVNKISLQMNYFEFIRGTDSYKNNDFLQEILLLEWKKYYANESIQSNVLNYIQILYAMEKFKNFQTLAENDFLKVKLKLVEGSQMLSTHYNWRESELNDKIPKALEQEQNVLLLVSFNGTIELVISDLLAVLLDFFIEEKTIENAIKEIQNDFKDQSLEIQQQIKNSVIQNILYSIQEGVLLPSIL